MAQPDQRLQDLQFLPQPQGPAAGQTGIVVVFGLHAGGLAEHVPRIEDFEEIDQPHVQGSPDRRIAASSAMAADRCPPPALKYTKSMVFISIILRTDYDQTVNLFSW